MTSPLSQVYSDGELLIYILCLSQGPFWGRKTYSIWTEKVKCGEILAVAELWSNERLDGNKQREFEKMVAAAGVTSRHYFGALALSH